MLEETIEAIAKHFCSHCPEKFRCAENPQHKVCGVMLKTSQSLLSLRQDGKKLLYTLPEVEALLKQKEIEVKKSMILPAQMREPLVITDDDIGGNNSKREGLRNERLD